MLKISQSQGSNKTNCAPKEGKFSPGVHVESIGVQKESTQKRHLMP